MQSKKSTGQCYEPFNEDDQVRDQPELLGRR